MGTLQQWSSHFGWNERARLYDSVEEGERTARRRMVVEQGLANDFARIQLLKALGQKLRREIFANGIFHTHVTIIHHENGDTETIQKSTYNSALVNDLLRVLDHIAKEKGERQPLPGLQAALCAVKARVDYFQLSLDQIERLKHGDDTLVEILLEPYLLPVE